MGAKKAKSSGLVMILGSKLKDGKLKNKVPLEAQLPCLGFLSLRTLDDFILSVTQGPTIWVPGHLGF